MCRAIQCPECKKTTWAGCGRHIDQVMAMVPESQRCHHKPTSSAEAAAAAGQPKRRGGIFGSLFGGQ